MEILIVRHGEAVDEAQGFGDEGRFLTDRGRKVSRRVAKWLAKKKARTPQVIWTSGAVRSVQTAEILAHYTGATVVTCAELAPGADPSLVITRLRADQPKGLVALVGHEPSLSALVSLLVREPGYPTLRKSGVVGVTWDGVAAGTVRFALDPKSLKANHAQPVSQQLDGG
jgi:phosphohistidine phosphatase